MASWKAWLFIGIPLLSIVGCDDISGIDARVRVDKTKARAQQITIAAEQIISDIRAETISIEHATNKQRQKLICDARSIAQFATSGTSLVTHAARPQAGPINAATPGDNNPPDAGETDNTSTHQ